MKDASVTFRKESSSPIRFIINGDRSAAPTFEGDLINELAAGKQWYSPLGVSFYPWYTVGASFSILMLVLVVAASNLEYIPKITGDLFFFKVFMPWIVLWPLSLLVLNAVFTPIIFDLGHGARRQRRRVAVVSFILFTIVAGLLINLSSDFLKDWLTKSVTATHS
jgi:hypothetical protein